MKNILKKILMPLFCLIFMAGCSVFLPLIPGEEVDDPVIDNPETPQTVCQYVTNSNYSNTASGTANLSSTFNFNVNSKSSVKIAACYQVNNEEVETQTSGFIYSSSLDQQTQKYTYYIVTSASGIFYRYIKSVSSTTTLDMLNDVETIRSGAFEICMQDGHIYEANLVGFFDPYDICVLKFESEDIFETVTMGDSDSLEIGDVVYTIGTPTSGNNLINTMLKGEISGLNRLSYIYFTQKYRSKLYGGEIATYPAFQYDASLNFGMQGSAIFNYAGEVIGMATYRYGLDTQEFNFESLSFALASNDLVPIVNSIIQTGSFTKPLLGVTVSDLYNVFANAGNQWLETYHVYSGAFIVEGGIGDLTTPAGKAGLEELSVITKLENNGKEYPIENLSCLYSALVRIDSSKPIVVTYVKSNGQVQTKTLNIHD